MALRSRIRSVTPALVLLATLAATNCKAVSFTPLGGRLSYATGVADDSTVVGFFLNADGFQEAFRWHPDDGMVGLGDLAGGSFASRAYGVSADGSVIVGVGNSDTAEAFRWSPDAGLMGLGGLPQGTSISWARSVSGDGSTIVGHSFASRSVEAVRWTADDGIQSLGLITEGLPESQARAVSNDGSVIVGFSDARVDGNVVRDEAFRWTMHDGMVGLGVLPGKTSSVALGVSANGSIVVGESRSSATSEAFRWTTETGMVSLGFLPGAVGDSWANALSDDGSVIVGGNDSQAGSMAVVWDDFNGCRALYEILNQAGTDLGGWSLTSAEDISGNGRYIVGIGRNPAGEREAWLVDLGPNVPEPATWSLLVIGVLGVAVFIWR